MMFSPEESFSQRAGGRSRGGGHEIAKDLSIEFATPRAALRRLGRLANAPLPADRALFAPCSPLQMPSSPSPKIRTARRRGPHSCSPSSPTCSSQWQTTGKRLLGVHSPSYFSNSKCRTQNAPSLSAARESVGGLSSCGHASLSRTPVSSAQVIEEEGVRRSCTRLREPVADNLSQYRTSERACVYKAERASCDGHNDDDGRINCHFRTPPQPQAGAADFHDFSHGGAPLTVLSNHRYTSLRVRSSPSSAVHSNSTCAGEGGEVGEARSHHGHTYVGHATTPSPCIIRRNEEHSAAAVRADARLLLSIEKERDCDDELVHEGGPHANETTINNTNDYDTWSDVRCHEEQRACEVFPAMVMMMRRSTGRPSALTEAAGRRSQKDEECESCTYAGVVHSPPAPRLSVVRGRVVHAHAHSAHPRPLSLTRPAESSSVVGVSVAVNCGGTSSASVVSAFEPRQPSIGSSSTQGGPPVGTFVRTFVPRPPPPRH